MEQQFFLSVPYSPGNYLNPVQLASKISKTASYESLTLEEKVQRLEKGLEKIQNNIPNVNNCKEVFFQTIMNLMNNSEDFMKDFYEESPDYFTNESILSMMQTLSWLSYPDNIKKDILDKDLENYFEISSNDM